MPIEVSKSGDAPWIIAVQRQLVGGAVVTKEVLRSQERRRVFSTGEAEAMETWAILRHFTVKIHIIW